MSPVDGVAVGLGNRRPEPSPPVRLPGPSEAAHSATIVPSRHSSSEGGTRMRRGLYGVAAVLAATVIAALAASTHAQADHGDGKGASTTTPIKHLVVIFQENVSFDHYFAT